MPNKPVTEQQLLAENEDLRVRLAQAEETLREMHSGEVDALVVPELGGAKLFTLKDADQSFRMLVEEMSEGAVTITAEGVIVYANRHFAGMLKTPLEKVIGSAVRTWISPGSQPSLQSLLEKGAGDESRGELVLAASDGTGLPVLLSVSNLRIDGAPDAYCLVVTDLTEHNRSEAIAASEKLAQGLLAAANQSRQQLLRVIEEKAQVEKVLEQESLEALRANAELRESERRFSDMLGNVEMLSVMRDVDARITYCNDFLLHLTGWRHEEVIGQDWLALFVAPEAVDAKKKIFAGILLHLPEARHHESEILTRSGERRLIRWSNSVLRSATGEAIGTASIGEDITERVRIATDRASLEAQLRESQKMEAIGTLAGGIAHDFNNILATILGNVELARQDVSIHPQALESLEEIRKAGSRARDLVQQILAFSRRQTTERKVIALCPIIEESARLLRATLPARVAITVSCDIDAPPVLADATQIEQVLVNLATNAAQAMPVGPGRIDINLSTVPLDAAMVKTHPALGPMHAMHPGHTLRLAVTDSGSGMDSATLARIFEPFFTTKPVGEGTGLGLSVVHGIVQAHEGAMTVDSQPGRGTTFAVYLPAAEAAIGTQATDQSAARPELLTSVPVVGGGEHILYVDDDESLVFLIRRLMERRGYRISGYTDARDALDTLRADPATFDLVVTDYNMPGMSGLDVARAVRAIRADLPVAVASGFIDDTLRAQADEAGVRELVFKASAVEDLCDAFARLAQAGGEKSKPS